MFSLIAYLHDNPGRVLIAILIYITLGCNDQEPDIGVSPKNFKVQTPFIISGRGIIINTYWGTDKKHHVLCLDNYSPPWIKRSAINYDKSFIKAKDRSFHTSAADGTSIEGEIGICDSLSFENIAFSKVPFYVMPHNPKDNVNDDGVFGIELMSKGVWKIDFRKNELTFTSSIDSLEEIGQAEIFPSDFAEHSIKLDVKFKDNITKTVAIDLGYNGEMLVPYEEFTRLSTPEKIMSGSARFSTPASGNIVNNLSSFDTVNINHNWFYTEVSSNETVKESVLGLRFFKRFEYVIFDFINKRLYIPKRVW